VKYLFLIIILTSCGVVPPRSVGENAPAGIHVDMTVYRLFKSRFNQVQACTGIHAGTFESLAIVIMPNAFSCLSDTAMCSGEFTPPNIIKIGNQVSWKHEVVHALLYAKHGDADGAHVSEFFQRCI